MLGMPLRSSFKLFEVPIKCEECNYEAVTKSLVKPRGEDIQEVQKFLSVAVNKKVKDLIIQFQTEIK